MNCRVCDSTRLDLAVDLGRQPWCNHFLRPEEVGREPFYPLQVVYCRDCATAQLNYTVPKEVMFGNHTYLSGITKSLDAHFLRTAREVDQRFFASVLAKSMLDIGSNDGTQLRHYKDLGYSILGVESSKTTAQMANERGLETVNAFFNLDLVHELGRKFEVINAAGVFFHLEELHSVAEGIREALRPDGVFVVQFLYMKRIVENLAFDQIYHEHLLYYNLHTIERLLNRHGLAMFDASLSPIHGGSVIGYVTHQGRQPATPRLEAMCVAEQRDQSNEFSTYVRFAERARQAKTENRRYLEAARQQGKRVFGMGAPVKGNTLLNYFEISPALVECLVEKNPLRKGLFSPGMHIPVILEEEVSVPPDIYYVLAWNFKEEILANNRQLLERGVEFFFPVDPLPITA